LPLPFGPTTAVIAPGGVVNDTRSSASAVERGYRTVTPSKAIM
jgi:hypothetical protein